MTTDEIMSLVDQCVEAEKNDYLSGEGSADYHRAALLKAVEELAADAARYRWLRNGFRAMSLDMGGKHTWVQRSSSMLRGPSVDEAIDAAIAKATGEQA